MDVGLIGALNEQVAVVTVLLAGVAVQPPLSIIGAELVWAVILTPPVSPLVVRFTLQVIDVNTVELNNGVQLSEVILSLVRFPFALVKLIELLTPGSKLSRAPTFKSLNPLPEADIILTSLPN